MHRIAAIAAAAVLASCSAGPPGGDRTAASTTRTSTPTPADRATAASAVRNPDPGGDGPRLRTVRLSGVLEAVRSTRVVTPALTGPVSPMTLTRIVPNGAIVRQGDIVAEFDPLEQMDQARESAASYEDLSFQVRQRQADNVAHAERRRSERQQAEAELEKALLEVSKATVLSDREAKQNELRAAKARAQIESMARTHPEQERADRAALRILELQRDRQKAAYDRAQANLEKLRIRAPISGMVAHSTRYSSGAMVRPQQGDRLTRNNALLSIFDPGEMLVRVSVAEPDGALLQPGLEATVFVDAYPDLAVPAHFVSASPVAAAPILTGGLKSFRAVFRIDGSDARLMPDLSAAVVFQVQETPPAAETAAVLASRRGEP